MLLLAVLLTVSPASARTVRLAPVNTAAPALGLAVAPALAAPSLHVLPSLTPRRSALPMLQKAVAAQSAQAVARRMASLYEGNAADVAVGAVIIDDQAPGAHALLESLRSDAYEGGIVLGAFDAEEATVLNETAYGKGGVNSHKQIMPPNADLSRVGGYTLLLETDGKHHFRESGGYRKPIDARSQRAILKHMGVRPARENWLQKSVRAVLSWADGLAAMLRRI